MNSKITMLKMADVIPTPDNPRRIAKGDPKIEELANSIQETGLLQPVVCRPHPQQPGKYDLRAGFRRFLAHELIGAREILAIVREMDDATAMEVTVLENLQREQLTPLEEARGVQALIDTGHSIKDIAADIGKPPAWVHRRASLTKLIPELVKLCSDQNTDWSRASAAHLEVVARLPAERQKKLANDQYFRMEDTAGKLARIFEREEKLIASAPWDLDDMTLEGATFTCTGCMRRTDVQPELFMDDTTPEVVSKRARCLDPECWKRKNTAWVKIKIAEMRTKHGDKLIVAGDFKLTQDDSPIKCTHGLYGITRCKKSAKGARPAIMIDNGVTNIGWATVYGNHDREPQRPKQPSLEMKRKAWVIKHVEEKLSKEHPPVDLTFLATVAALFGTSERNVWAGSTRDIWVRRQKLQSSGRADIEKTLWAVLLPTLRCRLHFQTIIDCQAQYDEAISQALNLYGTGEDALMHLAEAALPDKKTGGKAKQKREGK